MNTAAPTRGRWAFRLPFGLCLFAIEQLGRREDRLADNFSGDSPLPGNFFGQHPAEGNAANNVIRLNKETLCN